MRGSACGLYVPRVLCPCLLAMPGFSWFALQNHTWSTCPAKNLTLRPVWTDPVAPLACWVHVFDCYTKDKDRGHAAAIFHQHPCRSLMWTQNSSLKEDSTFLFWVIFETSSVFSQSLLFWSYFKTWPRIKLEEQVPSIYHLTKISLFFPPSGDWLREAKFLNIKTAFFLSQKNLDLSSLGSSKTS